MAVTVKVFVKDFNPEKLQEELAALPIQGITWAGFIRSGERLYTPFPEESRVVGRSSIDGDDVALRGELRFFSPGELTAPQNASLDAVLAAHNSATLTAEQGRQNQDNSDLDALLLSDRPAYINQLQSWDTIANLAQLRAATKVMFIIIGKVLRVFIRNSRGGANI